MNDKEERGKTFLTQLATIKVGLMNEGFDDVKAHLSVLTSYITALVGIGALPLMSEMEPPGEMSMIEKEDLN